MTHFPLIANRLALLPMCFLLACGAALADPYQRSVKADCVAGEAPQCTVSFPEVASGKRLEVEYIGCEIRSLIITHIGDFSTARVMMQAVDGGQITSMPLSVADASTSVAAPDAAYSTLSTAVKFLVGSNRRLKIVANLRPTQIPASMSCTANGQLKP